MPKNINVALIGNPNTGKTSVFNHLTGLNQQVGNYPGITVEKKEGICKLPRGLKAHILDLPGTYSLNASSLDENVVIELLLNKNDKDYPDVAVVVSDVENLKRNLLLFTQIKDLGLPTILVINMADRMKRKAISLDIPLLEKQLKTKIALVSARKKEGIEELKELITNFKHISDEPCVNASVIAPDYFDRLKKAFPNQSLYKLWLVITQDVNFGKIDRKRPDGIASFKTENTSTLKRLQQKETILRYQFINGVLREGLTVDKENAKDLRARLDRILTHKVWGYLIFFGILLLIFQAIYDWSSYPMDFIDGTFASLGEWVKQVLPAGAFTNLISEGIIPGLGGIIIFIPQIAFLFLFISVLEESGYMSRVVFLMDRIMRRFGLSGKSVVPLVSGTACAIPAVMASRNIESWKERLITILVVPFTTCSARLPVYLIIIALVIPEEKFLFFNLQGLTLMLLYLLGFGMAIFSAFILNKILKIKSKTYFVIEMPNYKLPMLKNVAINVIEKTKSFVVGAGKIILAISIVLWVLASYGPGEKFENAETYVTENIAAANATQDEIDKHVASYKLENSYIGIMGKFIEPAVSPLGYDWKIGIAIVSSFAAREVFVGTLATIYSVGSDEEETIKRRMAAEVNPILGGPLFNLASGISLLLFYAFAMQCMSTLAIVKRETNTWKWPVLQLGIMTAIAYVAALVAFQLLK
ncbi:MULTISPECIES: ferrous iron transport protein B [Croceibacter]|jgi:ferrous iron transport protein B|uniref:Ferrous iron transport protein B n=1 Tax=Croceibacter atlanticus (strain ATCC BAA-628 / JCM 21780 / CIP 108009 / IAM 15332 / KCTC 12090 / HTCC2559) TaxID=216432 RepID=A3U6M0_CROAH|nr:MULTISPECIES: ferrous iron transport protein B [Croceibacter]HAT69198.1 ferrous iron transport protein B [Flavobacteriaceae bacterium]EAP87887.1 ferrous iron transport protein B-like protein [Croceibacter atlanticus HTCC2559]MAM22404.1 ferrous iron transport protein B [Croceibacter sp.]MBG25401.1 ferrous iron transport protein B [Croceibacter sp.]MBW4969891.1 ferrous iron transport protein B [Croceibacter atlanticus]|tara:strand:- start:14953 stop:17052 length:2100 start_codon:yes stop_codon:yes gene_type:complete